MELQFSSQAIIQTEIKITTLIESDRIEEN